MSPPLLSHSGRVFCLKFDATSHLFVNEWDVLCRRTEDRFTTTHVCEWLTVGAEEQTDSTAPVVNGYTAIADVPNTHGEADGFAFSLDDEAFLASIQFDNSEDFHGLSDSPSLTSIPSVAGSPPAAEAQSVALDLDLNSAEVLGSGTSIDGGDTDAIQTQGAYVSHAGWLVI